MFERCYSNMNYALTTHDTQTLLDYYRFPFKDDGKRETRAQVKAELQQIFDRVNRLEGQLHATVRLSDQTTILDMRRNRAGEILIKNRDTMTLCQVATGTRQVCVNQSTDVWKKVGQRWKMVATFGEKQISAVHTIRGDTAR